MGGSRTAVDYGRFHQRFDGAVQGFCRRYVAVIPAERAILMQSFFIGLGAVATGLCLTYLPTGSTFPMCLLAIRLSPIRLNGRFTLVELFSLPQYLLPY